MTCELERRLEEFLATIPDPFDHPRTNDGDAPYGQEMSAQDYQAVEVASRTGRW